MRDERGGRQPRKRRKAVRLRRVEQRGTVQGKGIEEEGGQRQLAPQRSDVQAASEPAHGDLERQGTAVGSQGDDLTVQNELAGRQGARDLDHLRHGCRDVAQVARVDAHLVARLVHLNARAIELVLERRIVHAVRTHRRRPPPSRRASAARA